MIQFHSRTPFEGPWAAFVKTIVMMTSEFDYEALFDEENTHDLSASIVIIRIIFVIFLILAAIVLMNLMVGVAVNDINDLEILGNIQRLAKQVQFLSTLDTLVYNKLFTKILPKRINERVKTKRNVSNILAMYPGKPRWKNRKLLPVRIREAIFERATRQKKISDDESAIQALRKKLDAIHDKVIEGSEQKQLTEITNDNSDEAVKNSKRHKELVERIDEIDDDIDKMGKQMTTYANDSKVPLEKMNVKIDQLSIEIETIKDFLIRLENKLGKM